MVYNTETRTAPCGTRYRVDWEYDDDHSAPETEADGHGVVVEMNFDPEDYEYQFMEDDDLDLGEIARHKMMRRLSAYERGRGAVKYYDVLASLQKAKEEGWGIDNPTGLSPDEVAQAAVDADFKYLYGWYNDHWHWCGITVTLLDTDEDGEESGTEWESSLWGVSSDDDEHHEEVIAELLADALGRRGKATTVITEETT